MSQIPYTTIKGKVIDSLDNGNSVPGARVMITNSKGELVISDAQVRSESNGDFSISIPSFQVSGKYVTVTTSVDKKTVPIPFGGNLGNIDIASMMQQDVDEVIASADSLETTCFKENGTWDSEKRTCSDGGFKAFLKKHKTKIGIVGGLILMGVIVAIIVKATRK